MVIVGDELGKLSIYKLKEIMLQEPDSPTAGDRGSPPQSFARKDSFMSDCKSEEQSNILSLDMSLSPGSSPGKKVPCRNYDPKFAYGYFVNRNQYYKQCLPLYSLDLKKVRNMEAKLPIVDMKMNLSNTRLYICQADGKVRYM